MTFKVSNLNRNFCMIMETKGNSLPWTDQSYLWWCLPQVMNDKIVTQPHVKERLMMKYLGIMSGCKENHFYRLPFRQAEEKASWRKGKLKLAFASPDVTSTNPKNFLTSRIDFTVPLLFNYSSKNITCPSDKLKTGFTSPIAKSTNPRLLDTTLHTECWPQFQVFLFWLKLLLGLLSLSYFPSIY